MGQALSFGHNISLLTLKLDYNHTLGTEGVATLCRGLRTNIALKQLHLQFCNITSESGVHLAELLANTNSNLDTLNLTGNRLAGKGLSALCKGLMVNTKLENLIIADNMIDQVSLNRDFLEVTLQTLCLLVFFVVDIVGR